MARVLDECLQSLKRDDFSLKEKKQVVNVYQQMVKNALSFKLRKENKESEVPGWYFTTLAPIELKSFVVDATAAVKLGEALSVNLSLETLERNLGPLKQNTNRAYVPQ
jgi:hypothetical protein